jgi:hypothetical protein
MIKEHRLYGAPAPSVPMPATARFITSIEENMLQIETLLLTGTDKIEGFLNALVEFIASKIEEKHIAGRKSQFIAHELLENYKESNSSHEMSY